MMSYFFTLADAAQTAIQTAAPAAEPAAQDAPVAPAGGFLTSFGPILLIMIVFMFFMSRSQKKQQQKRQQMLDSLVKGSEVMLSSGIYGKIDAVEAEAFLVEIAPGMKIKVAKNGVAGAVEDKKEETK
ncbi:MAG: preprotein translocase subunit YajC [Victivallaceae bacterium]|nr:preprotein translocase subunit YajC [Victivallaceae bacterium]